MAVSPAAQREGVQVGQSLADARALYPTLTVRHADPAADLKALDSLSAACERYIAKRTSKIEMLYLW